MRRFAIISILVVAIGSGALREYLFVNLNYQIDHVGRGTEFSYADSTFKAWTLGWDLQRLEVLKWTFAVGYVVLLTTLAVWMARLLFGHSRHARYIVVAVFGVAGLALLLHLLSAWLPPLADVAVKLLHMLQYPVVLLVLLAANALGRASAK